MMKINWTFYDGKQKRDFSAFPDAFRSMWFAWRHGIEGQDSNKNPLPKRLITEMANSFSIIGPPNLKGERRTYSFSAARQMAQEQGWFDGENINGREFKKPRPRIV